MVAELRDGSIAIVGIAEEVCVFLNLIVFLGQHGFFFEVYVEKNLRLVYVVKVELLLVEVFEHLDLLRYKEQHD